LRLGAKLKTGFWSVRESKILPGFANKTISTSDVRIVKIDVGLNLEKSAKESFNLCSEPGLPDGIGVPISSQKSKFG
jgi:hypothetical protein